MLATKKNNELIVVRKDEKENKFYDLEGKIVEIKDLIIPDSTLLTGYEKEVTFYQYLEKKVPCHQYLVKNNNLFVIEQIINSVEDYLNNHYCYGLNGFQVNVKYCTDREKETPSTMEELSEEDITSAVDEYTESVIDLFKEYAMNLNENIIDVGLAGKSNGWLEIATTVPVCQDLYLREKLSECSEELVDLEVEYKSVELMILFIHLILPEIKKRQTEFEDKISSEEFWIQEKNSIDSSLISDVRNAYSKLAKITNGMQAWITYASWGYAIRFYPVNLGYSGMIEKTEDGNIRLVETL